MGGDSDVYNNDMWDLSNFAERAVLKTDISCSHDSLRLCYHIRCWSRHCVEKENILSVGGYSDQPLCTPGPWIFFLSGVITYRWKPCYWIGKILWLIVYTYTHIPHVSGTLHLLCKTKLSPKGICISVRCTSTKVIVAVLLLALCISYISMSLALFPRVLTILCYSFLVFDTIRIYAVMGHSTIAGVAVGVLGIGSLVSAWVRANTFVL